MQPGRAELARSIRSLMYKFTFFMSITNCGIPEGSKNQLSILVHVASFSKAPVIHETSSINHEKHEEGWKEVASSTWGGHQCKTRV